MWYSIVVASTLSWGFADAGKNPPLPPAIGAKVADFEVSDTHSQLQSLQRFRDKKLIVVVFIGTECPLANLYVPTLAELHANYSKKNVQFLAINSNLQDSFADVAAHARQRGIPFPVLKDSKQDAAEAFGARRTPEVFVLDSRHVIRYRGHIDDQYGYTYHREAPTRTELKNAIEELLAGKPVTVPETTVRGCIIGRAKNTGSKPESKRGNP